MKSKIKIKGNEFWWIMGAVYLLLFYAAMYSDILITTSHGINFWDVLFKGDILNFYTSCVSDVNNAGYQIYNTPAYDFIIFIIFAIWNFPLWIVKTFLSVNIWESVLCLIWAKSIIMFFIILVLHVMVKICHTLEFDLKKIKQVALLYLTSSFLFSGTFVMSQYDVIYLFLMVVALHYFLKKQLKGFTLFMALALTLKPLSLFLFAPLLLYKEKNIIKIGLHTICVLLPWLACKVIFPMGDNGAYMNNVLIMFQYKIEIARVEIPVFFLAVFFLYFFCYTLKTQGNDKAFYLDSLRIAFVAYALFFMICGVNPYWVVLIIPFQCLLIVANERCSLLSAILETIASICLVASQVWRVCWCFDSDVLRSSYIAKIFGERADYTNNITDVIHTWVPSLYDLAQERAAGMLFGLFFTGTAVFIWVNCGKLKNNALENKEIPNYLFAIRMLLGVCICMLPVVAYIF